MKLGILWKTTKRAFEGFAVFTLAVMAASLPLAAQSYTVTNIVSDGSVQATLMDSSFINPWGISFSPVWWISAQGTGYNYVVSPTPKIAFKVGVPPASGTAAGMPAGSVTAAGATGLLLPNGSKASFLFSTLDGTISGWNGKLGTTNAVAEIAINNNAAGASYPGLAILTNSTSSYILAANFGKGDAIEVYDNTFKSTKLAGSFTDPTLPANYAPFSVHVLGSQVFVAYALRTSATPYAVVSGSGNGIVSVFDTSGNFVSRVVTGGNLNAPWGVAIAPATFGIFSSDLLIGNFGDGTINVYDPKSFSYLGQLMDTNGKSLVYASLWELLPGGTAVAGTTSASGGDPSTVYFTAGLTGEAHGLLGGIASTTSSGSTPTFGFSASEGAATVTAGSSTQATISVAPVNGFSGTVSLTCSGLPTGATCSFSPAQLNVSATAASIGMVTIGTRKRSSSSYIRSGEMGMVLALLLPVVALRRRRLSGGEYSVRLLSVILVLAIAGFIVGCGSTPGTPAGQSTVMMKATSGMISQQISIVLTVQ